ncbi:MAG: hypothetical protein ACJ8F1_19195 [Polyangia bacterium]
MIRTAAALALLAVGVAASPAQAQLDGAAVANVAAGATNNPLSLDDTFPKNNDEFTFIRAGLQARYVGRRSQQALSYTYGGTFYAETKAANTNAHDLLWALLASPTARTELQAQVDGTYGRLNSLNPIATLGAMNAQSVAGATFAGLPTGPVTYAAVMASLSGLYRPTAVKNWSELTTFTEFIPIHGDASKSFVLAQSGHFDRSWGRDALTLDVLGSYFNSSPTPAGAGGQLQLPGTNTVDAQGLVGWRHEFSPAAFVAASGGIVVLDTPGSGGTLSVEPVVSGTAHYQTKVALAELIVSQSVQLNVYLGQPLLVDGAIGRLVIPLDRLERLNLVGVGTAQRQWTFGPPVAAAMDLLAANVGLAFVPLTYPLVAAIDYTAQEQIGHTVGPTSYPSLHRQVVMLTLTARWGTTPAVR